jgi:hypothetical protein
MDRFERHAILFDSQNWIGRKEEALQTAADSSLTRWKIIPVDEPLSCWIRTNLPKARSGSSNQVTDPGHATAIAQRMTLTAQLEMRTFRKIGERITNLLRERASTSWGFAAPIEINGLDRSLRERLALNLPRDLTRIPQDALRQHFRLRGSVTLSSSSASVLTLIPAN